MQIKHFFFSFYLFFYSLFALLQSVALQTRICIEIHIDQFISRKNFEFCPSWLMWFALVWQSVRCQAFHQKLLSQLAYKCLIKSQKVFINVVDEQIKVTLDYSPFGSKWFFMHDGKSLLILLSVEYMCVCVVILAHSIVNDSLNTFFSICMYCLNIFRFN